MNLKFTERQITQNVTMVNIEGEDFPIEDVYRTIGEVKKGTAHITDTRLAAALLNAKVIEHPGTKHVGASRGPNLGLFEHKLREKMQ